MLDNADRHLDRILQWLGLSLLALAILMGLAAAWLFATASPAKLDAPPAFVTPGAPRGAAFHVTDSLIDELPAERMRQFALNALLAPLIDDADPARWTDVGLDFMCDPSTRVLVDGRPFVSGSPIPTNAFTIRWDMNHCEPMGPETPLSGGVDLLVSYDGSDLTALVVPDRLHVHSTEGRASLVRPFTARLSLVSTRSGP